MRTIEFAKKLVILTMVIAAVTFASGLEAQEGSFVNFTGELVKVTGEVQIRKAGEKVWTKAEHGMEVGVKDEIKTGADASADITFVRNGQRSKIRILEEADMSLMTLNLDKVTGDSEILLDLAIGHIIIKTDPLKGKSRFEVLTPTCLTAVRGTGFEVKVVRDKGPVANEGIIQ